MPTRESLIAVIAIFAFTLPPDAAFGQSASQASQVPVLSPGVHNLMFQRPGERLVRYALSVPANYSPSTPVPLVLSLHFGAPNPTGAGRAVLDILVGPALAELGAIIVSPDSQAGQWSSPENEHAVITLLDAVIASYRIDAKRIVVTGFSMGGAGTWHFAAKYPERFSAAVPVAGRPPESAAGWRLPVLAIHSRNDQVVPIAATETRIAELQKAGTRAELIALTSISHYETNRFVDSLRRAVPWLRETWK